ncbi:phosphotransferase family protein [Streptomyces sp. 4N509B]|uniref:phosphotransferase family protein n=1 Tax=Streptomyces sp. 4N509B TaxID=3457413 RepID=UPI003FD141AF
MSQPLPLTTVATAATNETTAKIPTQSATMITANTNDLVPTLTTQHSPQLRATEPTSASATTLHGNHRIWNILRPSGELASMGPLKAGRARPGVHRFDPRCFESEEDLLVELALLGVARIPQVHRIGPADLLVHGYIEGETLAAHRPPGTPLTSRQLRQLMDRFAGLAAIPPASLELVHGCPADARPHGSREFLRGLIRFTRRHVYAVHRPELHGLFGRLGLHAGVLAEDGPLARAANRLTHRPFCLLHGDLHRDNLIVARADGALWTIDWELALLGDPVYDLATHLHLMGYPAAQERRVVERWATAVTGSLPGAADGLEEDLPRYRAYKRVQSVFTDVIRQAHAVRAAAPDEVVPRLSRAVDVVTTVLRNAGDDLGLDETPSPAVVESAYASLRHGAAWPVPR